MSLEKSQAGCVCVYLWMTVSSVRFEAGVNLSAHLSVSLVAPLALTPANIHRNISHLPTSAATFHTCQIPP